MELSAGEDATKKRPLPGLLIQEASGWVLKEGIAFKEVNSTTVKWCNVGFVQW